MFQEFSGVHWCDKFMTQVTVMLIKGTILLNLVLIGKEELLGHVGCWLNGHEMLRFSILRGGNKVKCEITNLDFRRDFDLLRDLFVRIL